MNFVINGIRWDIVFVNSNSPKLYRSDGSLTVGVTDWGDRAVYLSNVLRGAFLEKVLCHELCHCFCFSYSIHMPLDEEERLSDWISIYGKELIYLLDDLMKNIIVKAV